jgi:phage-related protein
MKAVVFMGDSLARIRAFPTDVRQDAGFQIDKVQRGENPDEWKSMKSIGNGVREIRIRETSGHYRVIYLSNLEEVVVVLHAFQKKTQKTRKSDIDLARSRLLAMAYQDDG